MNWSLKAEEGVNKNRTEGKISPEKTNKQNNLMKDTDDLFLLSLFAKSGT